MENNYQVKIEYSEKEYKERKRILKYLRGSKERFKNSKSPKTFEKNAKEFVNTLFDAFYFDEDYIMLGAINKACNEVKDLFRPHIKKAEIYRFLVILEGICNTKYIGIIERFYR